MTRSPLITITIFFPVSLVPTPPPAIAYTYTLHRLHMNRHMILLHGLVLMFTLNHACKTNSLTVVPSMWTVFSVAFGTKILAEHTYFLLSWLVPGPRQHDDVSSLVPPGAGPHHDPHHSHPHQHHQSQNTHQLVRHRGGPPPPPTPRPHRRFCCRKLTCTLYRGLWPSESFVCKIHFLVSCHFFLIARQHSVVI